MAAAISRRTHLLALMASDPALALAESVSFSEYAALPDSLRPYYEKPFHAVADLDVLPVCGKIKDPSAPSSTSNTMTLRLDGATYGAVRAGARGAAFSRTGAPLHGFTLGDRAVIAEKPLAILSSADAALLSSLPLGQRDASRDFATGAPLGPDPVVAIAGDRRLLFADSASAESFNLRLAAHDSRPGPLSGARAVLALPYFNDASVGFDWSAAEAYVTETASAWTETPKSTFFIRADFPDVAGSLTQASLANLINTRVASAITAMSYGKTTVTADVSATIIRLPQNSSAYVTSSGLLHDDAVAAYKALHGANSLDAYAIIGVQFPSIGANSSGIVYAGLATVGGSRQWLQGNPSEDTLVHEFGHNYGLGHSSSWTVTDGNPVSPSGSTVEYGDPFDVMGSGDSPSAHFHPQSKALLNWLTPSQWIDANTSGSGTYRLHRFDHSATTGGTRGLRVVKEPAVTPASIGYYWVGYRPGITTNSYLSRGAYLLWEKPGNNRSWLIDATPSSGLDRTDAALIVGHTYSDSNAGVHLTPLATGGSGADSWLDLHVELGAFPGNQSPSATFSPALAVPARSAQAFTVSASDPDGNVLAYGWDFGDGGTAVNAATVTRSWTVGGTYPVSVKVSDRKGGLVTRSATVTVSDPLLSWPAQTIAAGRTVRTVAYLRGRHFVGANRYLYSSLDRTTWTEIDTGSVNFSATAFTASASAFIAVGYDYDFDLDDWVGAVFRSTDGRVWKRVTLPAGVPELRSVATSDAGLLVAVGDAGTVLRSADHGATWTVQSSPSTPDLKFITHGGGLFMTVGDTNVFTSSDGAGWTDRSSSVLLASWQSFRTVLHANGAWYAGGWYSGVHRSTDAGQSWTAMAIADTGSHTIDGLAAGSGVLIAASTHHANDTNTAELLVSVDGLVWQPAPVSSPIPSTSSIAYADGAFHSATGSNGQLQRTDAFYLANQAPAVAPIRSVTSVNARRTVSFAASASDTDSDALTYLWDFGDGSAYGEGPTASHLFKAGGTYTVKLHVTDARGAITTVTRTLTVTEPLATWTQRTSGTTANLRDVASDGANTLVTVGGSSGTYRVSTNKGATWSAGGTLGSNITLRGICHGSGLFVAVGKNYDSNISSWVGTIYTSPNGTTWIRRTLGGAVLRDVVHGGGRFLATGDTGSILTSTDAITWNAVASGTTNNLHSVAYGAGTYVIAGANNSSLGGTVLVSANGDDWINTSSGLGTTQGLFDLDFTGGRFLASGFYARLRHSTDGGATFTTTVTTSPQAAGFASVNGLYLAVARDLANANAPQNLLSLDGANWTAIPTANYAARQSVITVGDTFLTVGDAGEIWQSAAVASSTSGYTQWRSASFADAPSLGDPATDADVDGVTNIAEYHAGTDPRSAASRPAAIVEILSGELTLSVPRATGISDVAVRFETSTDLATWTEDGVVIVDAPDELVGSVPLGTARRFLRARLLLSP
jgi:PKD repeat protein